MAGLRAILEPDIKKLVALSTLRQLGIMVVAVGLKAPFVALSHLVAHAFFKAILFVVAGNLIHLFSGYQDFRMLGAGGSSLPLRRCFASVALVNLIGLPFFFGVFY